MKVLKNTLAIIISFLLCIVTVLFFFFLAIQKFVQVDFVKDVIVDMDVEKIVNDNPQMKEELNQFLSPILEETKEYGIDEELILELINTKEVKTIFGDITGNIVHTLLTKEPMKIITNENVQELLKEGIKDINSMGIFEIKKEDEQYILQVVDDVMTEYQDFIPDTSKIEENFDPEFQNDLKMIRFFISPQLLFILLGVMAVLLILLMVVKWQHQKWIKWGALSILCSSIILGILGVLFSVVGKSFITDDIPYILGMIEHITSYIYLLAMISFGVMVGILILYHFMFHKTKPVLNE